MLRYYLAAVATPLIIFGCGSDAPRRVSEATGPHVIAVDSVLLEETDSLYVADPMDIAIDPFDGSFYISDSFSKIVIRYSRAGEPRRIYGRPGAGPGEFQGIRGVFVVNDSTLAVVDSRKRLLNFFSRESGTYRGSKRVRSPAIIDPIVTRKRIWLCGVSESLAFSIGVWDTKSDSVRYGGPVPAKWREYYPYMVLCPEVRMARWQDALLVGFCGANALRIVNRQTLAARDTVSIPTVRRRGIPDDIVQIVRENVRSRHKAVTAMSFLFALHRLPDGAIAVIYADASAEGEPPNLNYSSTKYLTVLSADLRSACVDRLLPSTEGFNPVVAFHGDTLFMIDRHIEGVTLETWIEMYEITDDGCTWLPTGFTG